MKKVFFRFVSVAALCVTPAMFVPANAVEGIEMSKKVLVVYYSWSGNTAELAKIIQKATGGDIFEIQTVKPYPKEYKAATEQAKKEINDGYKPAIKEKADNIGEYDVIFIGSPNWWGTIAPAVTTFLSEHDLSGKTVAPFFTHGGGGMQRCASDTAKLLPDSKVADALSLSGNKVKSAQKEAEEWVNKIIK
ncbi:MAG: NAD(P)H-dependent oxidoreductase [Endomicrobia bacterium]|nr:NAD(P)H-dependent oxidoreductase [Endomicrobiia bacterium]